MAQMLFTNDNIFENNKSVVKPNAGITQSFKTMLILIPTSQYIDGV